ncbi:MAG: zinc-binding alcohol dehydrogenase family protein [Acidimicrobiia bacterium]
MRAAQVTRIGAPPEPAVLSEPSVGDGEALIAVTSAALNPVELRVAAGRMPGASAPYVPGLEGVGTVISSTNLPEGTRVRFENDLPGFGKDGAIREIAVAEEATLIELPTSVDDTTAAAAGVVGVTAELAFRLAGMEGGERVAVLGATGGVGQIAVQLAAARGAASVVAVGRHRPSLDWLESNGATASVDLAGSSPLLEALQEAAGGPLDIVIDPLWGAPAMGAIAALGDGGRLVNVGNTAGTDVELPLQAMRKARSSVIGLSSGWTPLSEKLDACRFVIGQLSAGALKMNHEVESLESITEAWSRQDRFPHTKIVVSLI